MTPLQISHMLIASVVYIFGVSQTPSRSGIINHGTINFYREKEVLVSDYSSKNVRQGRYRLLRVCLGCKCPKSKLGWTQIRVRLNFPVYNILQILIKLVEIIRRQFNTSLCTLYIHCADLQTHLLSNILIKYYIAIILYIQIKLQFRYR